MTWLRSRALGLRSRAIRRCGHAAPLSQHVDRAACSAGGHAGRDADAVVRRAAHGEPGLRGHRGPDPLDPLQVADRVLRQAAAPAGDPGVQRAGRSPRARRSGRPAPARPGRRRRAAARPPRRAGPPTRGPRRRPGAAPAYQPHFVEEKVTALTDRPSTGGTRKPEPVGERRERRRREGERDHGHRRVARRRPARPPPPARVRRSSRAAAPAGTASTTASASTSLGRAGRADDEPPAVGVRRSSRTVAPVRTSAPRAPRDRGGQPPDAAAQARRTPRRLAPSPVGARPAGPGGGQQRALPAGVRRELRHRRLQRELVGPARVDPAEQRLDQPVDDRAAHPARDVAADRDVVTGRWSAAATSPPGTRASSRAREQPAARPARAGRAGTPMTVPGGSGCIAPRVQIAALVVAASSRSAPRPTAPGEVDRLGPAQQQRLGALVDRDAGDVADPQLAADLAGGLQHGRPQRPAGAVGRPRRHQAAASPAMPPPTTTTCRGTGALSVGTGRRSCASPSRS